MIIHWSEYTHDTPRGIRRCALHGETASGHHFHICTADKEETGSTPVELWVEGEGALDYAGQFPSETAAKIHAERLATTG